MSKLENILLVERYRPRILDDVILPKRVKEALNGGLNKNILLYSSSPGTGKTTIATILTEGKHFIKINASEQRGIDVVRDTITKFVRSQPLNMMNDEAVTSIVWLEEFDNMTGDAWKAMRVLMDEYAKNVRFLATCNYINRIEPAILSRFNEVNLVPESEEEKEEVVELLIERIKNISDELDFEWSNDEVIRLHISKYYPDIRSCISSLQYYQDTNVDTVTKSNIIQAREHREDTDFFEFFIIEHSMKDIMATVNGRYKGKVDEIFKLLTTSFPEYALRNENIPKMILPKMIELIFEINYKRIVTNSNEMSLVYLLMNVSRLIQDYNAMRNK